MASPSNGTIQLPLFNEDGFDSHTTDSADVRTLPTIVVTDRELRQITADAIEALHSANDPPLLFVRGSQIVRIVRDEQGRPFLQSVTEAALRGHLDRAANFRKEWTDRRGATRELPVSPPLEVVKDILALPQEDWRLPPLAAITEAPVLRPDGTLLLQPGYDRATRLFYAPSADLDGLEVPERPSPETLFTELSVIFELISDFPFADDASMANTLALLIAPIVRPLVEIAPMVIVNAPQAGTGKTLLGEVVFLVHTGAYLIATTAPSTNSEEWNKLLTAQLLKGRGILVFDNVAGRLESDALSAAITSSTFESRVLGRSEVVQLPQKCTFIATGNNMVLSEDLARRSVWIQLNAKTSNPYRRTGFLHPNLKQWMKENRRELLGALLTIVRAWFAAGQPQSNGPVIGSFEPWCRIVGGILAHAGIEGFLGNFDSIFEQADPSLAQWEGFFEVAFEAFCAAGASEGQTQTGQFTSRDLLGAIQRSSTLRDALPDELLESVKRESPQLLAKQMNRMKDRRFGDEGIHLICDGQTRNKVVLWRIRLSNLMAR